MYGRRERFDLAHVGQVEPLGQVEVELDGRGLPTSAQGIRDTYVYLRPVEDRFALDALAGEPVSFEGCRQRCFRHFPVVLATRVLVRRAGIADAQLHLGLIEAEGGQEGETELQDAVDLDAHLVGPAEQVGVVLGEAAYP